MKRPARKKLRTWLSRWFHRLLLLVTVVFLVAYMLVLSPLGQHLLVQEASKALQGMLEGKVELKGARTDFWSRVDLYGLSIVDTAGAGGMISIGHTRLSYFLPALLQKRLVLRSISLDKVVVDIQRAKDGRFPLLRTRKRDSVAVSKSDTSQRKHGSGFRLVVRSLTIRDARLRYRDERLLIDAGLADVEGRIRFTTLDSLDIRVRSSSGYANTPWWNGLLERVTAEGRLGRHGLLLRNATLSGPTVEITGRGYVPFKVEGAWNLSAHVQSALGNIDVLRRALPHLGDGGVAEAEASWTGPLSQPVLKLNLFGQGLSWRGLRVDSLTLEARYLSDQVLRGLVRLSGPVFQAEVREKVTIPLLLRHPRIRGYEVELQIDSLSYDWLRSRFALPTRTTGGSVTARCWARGVGVQAWPKELRVTANLEGWKGPDSSSVPVLADVSLQDGHWRLQLFWAANAVRGAGRLVRRKSVDGEIAADLGEPGIPALYFLGETLEGHLTGRVQVVGPILNPGLWFEVSGKKLLWHGVAVDSLWAKGDSRSGRLRITKSGCLAEVDLSSLGRKFGFENLTGRLSGSLRARGTIPQLKVEGDLAGQRLGLHHWRCDSLSGHLAFSGDTLRWTQLWLQKDTSGVRSHGFLVYRSGKLDLQGNVRLALLDSSISLPGGVADAELSLEADSIQCFLGGKGLDLAGLQAWVPANLKLCGLADLNARLWGHLRNPACAGEVTLRRVGWDKWQVASVRASGTLVDSLLQARGEVQLSDSESVAEFNVVCPFLPRAGWSVDTSASRVFLARVSADSLNLEQLRQFLPAGLQLGGLGRVRGILRRAGPQWVVSGRAGMKGGMVTWKPAGLRLRRITADAQIAGPLPLPDANLRLTAGHSSVGENALDSLLVEVTLDSAGNVGLSRFTSWADGGILTLQGVVPGLVAGKRFAFRGIAEVSNFPIAFVNAYTGPVRILKGALSGQAQVTLGASEDFRSEGDLEVLGGRVRVGEIEPELTNLRLHVGLRGDSLLVKDFGGNWGTGGFAGKGFLVLGGSGITAADLSVRGKELSVALPDVAEVRVSELQARLADKPGMDRLGLTGKVVLGESRFVRDLGLGDLVKALRGASTRPRQQNPFLQKLDLDVALVVPQTLVIDVNLGKMRLEGHLALSQSALRPAVTGEFRVVDGYIFYLDRKFEIEEATFRQLEPFRINPEINFRAVAEVRPIQAAEGPSLYRVTLSLTGDLEHPKLELRSEPPLSQADIISLLTIGRVRTGGAVAGEGEMGISEILVQRAKSITSQQVTGLAARQMERLLNLESVTIEGNLFQTNQVWGPRVTITKRLAERLNLTYQTVVGHTNEQRIRISYRIKPYLYLDGETDELGRAGIDLIARFRFK